VTLRHIKGCGLLTKFVFAAWLLDAARKWRLVGRFIGVGEKVLEVGTGPGSVYEVLRRQGLDVVTLDVEDMLFRKHAALILYDGQRMPFPSATFDTALLLTVLHHCHNPEAVIGEALRVARRVIVLEDTYASAWQRWFTQFMDSLVNLEFIHHPHNNRNHESWIALFGKLNARLIHSSERRFFLLFRQGLYVLEGMRVRCPLVPIDGDCSC
jgi:SAM-dependent methyltransferase